MKLFLMRHGEAETYAATDASRALTLAGQKESKDAGIWLGSAVPEVGFALVSPYLRAKQTFAHVADNICVRAHQVVDDIIPSGDASWVADYIEILMQEHRDIQSMLVVTHMPLISELLDHIVAKPVGVFFPTGGIAMIDMEAGANERKMTAFG